MAKGNPNSNFPNAQQPTLKPEEMGTMVTVMEELRELPKINTNDPEAIEERVTYFFEWCTEKQLRPGVELLALCLGTSRQSLWKWEQAGGKKGEIVERAKQVIAALIEQWSICGKINPATSCFLLKNHFGYKDQYDVSAVPANQLESLPTKEEVVKSIPQMSGGDNEPDFNDILEDG